MVFTVPVVFRGGHSRRRVLAGAAGAAAVAAAGGCGLFDHDSAPKPPDALQPLLAEALTLAAALDAAALAQPALARRLTPLAADHRAHVAALARVIGTPAPSAPAAGPSSPGAPGGEQSTVLKQLRAQAQSAARNAATACGATSAERAALVGSIAACRSTHAEALR
jgi:hypothetical protein